MHYAAAGKFFGKNDQKVSFDGITVTDTKYDYEFIDWHYHENPHFAFTIRGDFKEGTRRETFDCGTGTLLFHNYQEPHFNVKPAGITHGFQIEIGSKWSRQFETEFSDLQLKTVVTDPHVKLIFFNLYRESRHCGQISNLAIDSLLLESFEVLRRVETNHSNKTPSWVKRIDEILRDTINATPTLLELSRELGVHWAHLSRAFPIYFRCNFGQYLRKIRVERAMSLLLDQRLPIAEVALECGFADQSHLIRSFREFSPITPKLFRDTFR